MAGIDYDATSEGYDELYGAEQLRKYWMASRHVDLGGLGGWVVDVGCGTGLLLSFLRGLGCSAEYVGIDVSEAMLVKACLRADGLTHLIQADGNNLPLRGKSADTLLSFTAIHHLNPGRFAEEAARATRRIIVVSQHKRLKPRLNIEPVDEEVDELVVAGPEVFREAAGGPRQSSLPGGGQAGQG
jgi:SAM-dependent methyltransferase